MPVFTLHQFRKGLSKLLNSLFPGGCPSFPVGELTSEEIDTALKKRW